MDLTSLWAFKDKLTELKHYWMRYESTEGLPLHFRDQLESLLADRPADQARTDTCGIRKHGTAAPSRVSVCRRRLW